MESKELPSPELLRKILRYEPETGKLFWRKRPVEMFSSGNRGAEAHCKSWNKRFAESEAFISVTEGYRIGSIFNRKVFAHRVIWAMVHGEWPKGQMDHINHDRSDNRMENFRIVTNLENSRNASIGKSNTSGIVGVGWDTNKSKWRASIGIFRKNKHLGYFDCFTAAAAARKKAEIKYGFHENHGEKLGVQGWG